MPTDRRTFLQLLSGGALTASFPESIARALRIPANNRTGTIQDVEHIVILMQENRSFDHYFGTLRGVRGFGDPRAILLPSGKPVWYQPNSAGNGFTLPFHPTAPDLGLQFLEDLPHDWITTHAAWNQGKHDGWVPAKGTTTMAHLTRADIPYHFALADAFTICDAYHSSILSATDPNRYYMWTGWVGNDGAGGGPVVDNAEKGYGWSTYPERLQAAGVTWRIYQDTGLGLTAEQGWGDTKDAYIGNYGDNSLLYFHQYQNAEPGSPLAQAAKTGTNIFQSGTLFDQFKQDVLAETLPQVSWVVAPEAYSEHPNFPANYGAWYVSQVLDALTANPDVWSKTAFFITYDENDGFFDHVPPPTVPPSAQLGKSTVDTTNEIFPGSTDYAPGPYGLGIRVPMLVLSPWSKGGYVNSEVFDHTSILRFIEQRFGANDPTLTESNITPWRRAVCGDLTSAFNFRSPNEAAVPLPSTAAYRPPNQLRHADYQPKPPADQKLPKQERGSRPARALPYRMEVAAAVSGSGIALTFENLGKAAVFQVRFGAGPLGPAPAPLTYTVGTRHPLTEMVPYAPGADTYSVSVSGPNGFLRAFAGSIPAVASSPLQVRVQQVPGTMELHLSLRNPLHTSCQVTLHDAYLRRTVEKTLPPAAELVLPWPVAKTFGWYDLTLTTSADSAFRWQIAGHVENGADSVTDPAIGS